VRFLNATHTWDVSGAVLVDPAAAPIAAETRLFCGGASTGYVAPSRAQCDALVATAQQWVSTAVRDAMALWPLTDGTPSVEPSNHSGCFVAAASDGRPPELTFASGAALDEGQDGGCPAFVDGAPATCVCVAAHARPPAPPPRPPVTPTPSSPPYPPQPPCAPPRDGTPPPSPPPPAPPPWSAPTPAAPVAASACDGTPRDGCDVRIRLRSCLHASYLGQLCLLVSRPTLVTFVQAACHDTYHSPRPAAECFESSRGTVAAFADVHSTAYGFALTAAGQASRWDATQPHANMPPLDRLIHVLPIRLGYDVRLRVSARTQSFATPYAAYFVDLDATPWSPPPPPPLPPHLGAETDDAVDAVWVHVLTGTSVVQYSTGNVLVCCDGGGCVTPTTGCYCNPSIHIDDADDEGDSYVDFVVDLLADGDPCDPDHGALDASAVDAGGAALASQAQCIAVVDETELAVDDVERLQLWFAGDVNATALGLMNATGAVDAGGAPAPRAADACVAAPDDASWWTACHRALRASRVDAAHLHGVARPLARQTPLAAEPLGTVDGDATLDRRRLALAAMRHRAVHGSHLRVVRQRQRLSAAREGKTVFRYHRRCVASPTDFDRAATTRVDDRLTSFRADTLGATSAASFPAPRAVVLRVPPPPSPPTPPAISCTLDFLRGDSLSSASVPKIGTDGHLAVEFMLMEELMLASIAANSDDPFACAASTVPALECLDIAAPSTLQSTLSQAAGGDDASFYNILTGSAQNASLAVDAFGASELCGGQRVSDGVLSPLDLAVLLFYQFGVIPYDRLPFVPQRVPTVMATGALARRCGDGTTRAERLMRYALDPCAGLTEEDGTGRRRRASTAASAPRLEIDDMAARVRRWVDAPTGTWYRIELQRAYYVVELRLAGVYSSERVPLSNEPPPDAEAGMRGTASPEDPERVHVRFARAAEGGGGARMLSAASSVHARTSCAPVVPMVSVGAALAYDVLSVAQMPRHVDQPLCDIDLFVWVPAAPGGGDRAEADAAATDECALTILPGSIGMDGGTGTVQRARSACVRAATTASTSPSGSTPAAPPPPATGAPHAPHLAVLASASSIPRIFSAALFGLILIGAVAVCGVTCVHCRREIFARRHGGDAAAHATVVITTAAAASSSPRRSASQPRRIVPTPSVEIARYVPRTKM